MPANEIDGFTVAQAEGGLSRWMAAATAVLDHYAGGDRTRGVDADSLADEPQTSRAAEEVLRRADALRDTERFQGDEAALGQSPRLFQRIREAIDRGEPVILHLRPAGGGAIGHAMVVFGYDSHVRVLRMKDPDNPGVVVRARLDDVLLNFAPHPDDLARARLRYNAEKFVFTQKPPAWNRRRVKVPRLYEELHG